MSQFRFIQYGLLMGVRELTPDEQKTVLRAGTGEHGLDLPLFLASLKKDAESQPRSVAVIMSLIDIGARGADSHDYRDKFTTAMRSYFLVDQ